MGQSWYAASFIWNLLAQDLEAMIVACVGAIALAFFIRMVAN